MLQHSDNILESSEPPTKKPRYRRPKSKQACQRCSQRKVRCDVDSKNYPNEKCTNCEEFNVDCKLVEHKRKRTKNQIAEDKRLAEIQKLGTSSTYVSKNASTGSAGSGSDSTASPAKSNERHRLLDPYTDLKGDEILLDPDEILNRPVNRYQLSQFVKVLTSHYGLKMSMSDYYNYRGTIKMKDLATDECVSILKLSGCFTLPNEEDCKKYINSYFHKFQLFHPCFNKEKFYKDFGNPRNPKSLLMLRCILYVGCRMLNDDKSKTTESKVLYEKARLVANADMEPDGFFLSLSLYILGTPPTLHTSLQTMEDYLNLSIRVAIAFGMNKDLSKDDSGCLTKVEKTSYKFLFWLLMIKDRAYALSFSKNYNFERSSCTVEPLFYEDFLDRGLPDPQMSYEMYSHQIEISGLMDNVTNLEKKANIAALEFKPFVHYLNEINEIINEFYGKLESINKSPTTSFDAFFVNIYIFSMDLFVQKINLFRLYAVIVRGVRTESVARGGSHYLENEAEAITTLRFWHSLARSVHRLAETIITSALKYKELLPFCQDCIFLMYQGGCALLPMLFYRDDKLRETAEEDLKKILPVLNELSDLISWHMIDACYFILKVIYLDKPKLMSYVRSALNCKHDQELFNATKPFPFLNKLLLDNLPPIRYPLLQINVDNLSENSDFSNPMIPNWFASSRERSKNNGPSSLISDLNVEYSDSSTSMISNHQQLAMMQLQQQDMSLQAQENVQRQLDPIDENFLPDYYTSDIIADHSNNKTLTELQEIYSTQFGSTKNLDSIMKDISADRSLSDNIWRGGYNSSEALSNTGSSGSGPTTGDSITHSSPPIAQDSSSNNHDNIPLYQQSGIGEDENIDNEKMDYFYADIPYWFHPPMIVNPDLLHPPLLVHVPDLPYDWHLYFQQDPPDYSNDDFSV